MNRMINREIEAKQKKAGSRKIKLEIKKEKKLGKKKENQENAVQ